MIRLPLSSFVLAAVAACAALPASATVSIFSTTLSSAGEPVPTSPALGFASVVFDDAFDMVSVTLEWQGLANDEPFGHIHCCTALPGTGSAGVALGFTPLPQVATGNYAASFSLSAAAFDSLLAGTAAGKAYVNIHTPGLYGAGEIRGVLTPVPEPASYALMLGGLGLLSAAVRRRAAVQP
jgi:hypothetical protein